MIDDILNDTGKIIFVVLAFVILLELVMAFVIFNRTKKFIANALTVKATITKLELKGKAIQASIRLIDRMGRDVETSLMVPPAKKYRENDEIEVLSDKDKPEKVRFNSFVFLWIIPIAMLQGAVAMAVVLGIFVNNGTAKLPF